MTDRGKRLASGSAWLLVSQFIVFAAQLAYVAITSRQISQEGFGAYAVSLSAVALVQLLTNGGISQAAMRADDLNTRVLRGLSSMAIALGIAGSVVVVLGSHIWASAWGAPEAWLLVASSAILVLVAPINLLAQGLIRRSGRFRALALSTASVTVCSLSTGAVVAVLTASPLALVISSTLSTVLLLIVLQVWMHPLAMPGRLSGDLRPHLQFTRRVTLGGVLSYIAGNLPKFAVSRFAGSTTLGLWNRAESAVLSPFQLLQQALTQAVYPELRRLNQAMTDTARVRFSDLYCIIAWVTVVPASALAGIAPWLVPVFLGQQWISAVPYAEAMAILAAVTASTSMMSSSLEVAGRFKWTYFSQSVQITLTVMACAVGLATGQALVLAWAMVGSMLVRHVMNCWRACRDGFVDVRQLIVGYSRILLWSLAIYGITWTLAKLLLYPDDLRGVWLFFGPALLLVAAICGLRWRRLPPFALALKYGLLK